MSEPKGKVVTGPEIAAIFGVSERTVARHVKDGAPVEHRGTSKTDPSTYSTTAWHEWFVQKRIAALTPGDSGELFDYEAERARLTKFQADERELTVRTMQGELLPASLVRDLCAAMYSGVKAKLLAIAAKVKARHMDLEPQVLDDLDDEIRQALRDVADDGLPPTLRTRLECYRGVDEAAREADAE